jgi:branched-chain amino acid transport system substrate-binding protein
MEGTRGLTPLLLALVLGCTVGEARPADPAPADPGREAATPAPGEAVGPEADARAAALVERARTEYDVGEVAAALELARRVLALYPSSGSADEALWVAARASFGAGDYEEARRLADSYASRQPAGSDRARSARELAGLAVDAQARPADVAVGALIPRTGPDVLVQYGDLVLDGIRLAIREAESRQGRSIRLVVADDGGGARTAQAVAELERNRVSAIIGPLLPEQLPAAVGARADPELLMVSPTVPEPPAHWPNVYSVGGGDTRGAVELARYVSWLGMADGAILHARGPEHERRARAFAAEFQSLGGRILATVPYDSGTTTFAPYMRRILAAVGSGAGGSGRPAGRPFALFVSAPDRDVPQIAPQVSFYGLDAAGARVLGDAIWASETVRRLVPGRDLEGVVAASALPAERAASIADPDFVARFEQAYRRSLNNALPALGYDAAHLVLQALPNQALTPAATTRRFELLAGVHGATGTLSVRDARLVRTPHLVVIRNGRPEPVPEPWNQSAAHP